MVNDFKTKKMEISAGLLIVYNNKVLLCHPTNASWKETFSPPKGLIDDGEDLIDGAIRECYEEVGISINRDNITDRFIVPYKKGRSLYKKVYLFVYKINNLSDIGLESEVIKKENLQTEEVDWAGFVTKEEAEIKIFWRFKYLINEILN